MVDRQRTGLDIGLDRHCRLSLGAGFIARHQTDESAVDFPSRFAHLAEMPQEASRGHDLGMALGKQRFESSHGGRRELQRLLRPPFFREEIREIVLGESRVRMIAPAKVLDSDQ